jgi:hypothetical protein
VFVFSLVGTALIAVGGLLFFIRRRSAAMQAASVNWPTVPGKVTDAQLKSSRDNDNNVNYYAEVRYAYQVNGIDYAGNRVAWGGRPTSRSPDQAHAVLARYAVGTPVSVHYNPKKHSQAVLEPQEQGGLKNLAFIMWTFLVLGVIFFAIAFLVQD